MKKSKTKLIIAIIVILVIAIIAVVGAYLYFTTDLLKGNQELFLKYLSKNGESVQKLTETYIEEMMGEKYTTISNITFNVESNDTEIANQTLPAGNFSVAYSAKIDTTTNQKSSDTTIKYLSTDLFTVKYIRDNDMYAIKSDEVINKYLAFDNNNLKEFAEKFGVTDTTAIPNKLETINVKDLLLTQDEQKAIISKYLPVINAQISKDKYSNEKNVTINVNNKDVNANAYSLELTGTDMVNITTNVLDTLNADEQTLNIILQKIKLIDSQSDITINYIRNIIQDRIDSLRNTLVVNDETIKLTVYENEGKLLRTEVTVGNNIVDIDTEKSDIASRILISFGKKNINVEKEDNFMGLDFNVKKIELIGQSENNQNSMAGVVTFDLGDETIKVSMESKTKSGTNIQNTTTIRVNITDTTYITANINTTKTTVNDIEIEKLTNENSVIINKYTAEYLTNLFGQIRNRLQRLYTQKLEWVNTQE